jgi:hypothetical protein
MGKVPEVQKLSEVQKADIIHKFDPCDHKEFTLRNFWNHLNLSNL